MVLAATFDVVPAKVGMINDYHMKCISPEWMIKFHTGYELDEDDYRDVLALCQHFGISLPNEYEKFSQINKVHD